MNMKIVAYVAVLTLCFSTMSMAQKGKSKKTDKMTKETLTLNTEAQRVSYSLGVKIAENLTSQGFDSIDVNALAKAFEAVLKKDSLLINSQEADGIIQAFMQNKQSAASQKNVEAGKKFLEENAKKPGVNTLPSGLQYQVIVEGTGPIPTATDNVTTHYHGTLIDGKVFDSSYDRGQPASFPVNGVIQGWQEALQLMKVGSKWKLYIPANLAYGDRGAGRDIGPGSTLIFDIELISIDKK